MTTRIALTGDINLLNAQEPCNPFGQVKSLFTSVDGVFSNLECCFFDTKHPGTVKGREGFYVPTRLVDTLHAIKITAVGMANNVNFGPRPIRSSIKTLDSAGILYTGAGENYEDAHRPATTMINGIKIGFIQHSSIFWPFNHAAGEFPGIATLQAHTTYEPTLPHKPGSPPKVHTWVDPAALSKFSTRIKLLKSQCDVVISSHHWGLKEEVFDYQIEIARAAIDAGADAIMGHGAHMPLGIEVYKNRPIFYGLAHLFFLTGHGGKRQTGDGLVAKLTIREKAIVDARLSVVETTAKNIAIPVKGDYLIEKCKMIQNRSNRFDTMLTLDRDEIVVNLKSSL
ncbi:MAG: CapA family protein [Chloroflexota bacterium]